MHYARIYGSENIYNSVFIRKIINKLKIDTKIWSDLFIRTILKLTVGQFYRHHTSQAGLVTGRFHIVGVLKSFNYKI